MADILMCIEKDCQGDEKFTTNPKQFLGKASQHFGHKVAYFDELCDDFIQNHAESFEKQESNLLLNELNNLFETFKKDFLIKMNLHSMAVNGWIQANTQGDQGFQFYLSIVEKDFEKIRQLSNLFYLFNEPQTIKDGHSQKIDENRQKIQLTQKIMNQFLERYEFELLETQFQQGLKTMRESSQNQIKILETKVTNQEIIVQKEQDFDDLRKDYKASQQKLIQQEDIISSLQNQYQTLQNQLQASEQSLAQKQTVIEALQLSLLEMKQGVINVVPLAIPRLIQTFSFSQMYSPAYTIESSNIAIKKDKSMGLALMVPALDQTEGSSTTFGFKLKYFPYNRFSIVYYLGEIAIGMCHLDTIIKNEYQFNIDRHGCYMVTDDGCSLFHLILDQISATDSLLNNSRQNFQFQRGDTIFCTLNPTNKTLTFKKDSSTESYVMNYEPNQQLHPCVWLWFKNYLVEYIEPTYEQKD